MPPQPVLAVAEHARVSAHRRIPLCRELLAAQPGVRRLGFYEVCTESFSLDLLPTDRPGPPSEAVARVERRLNQQLAKLDTRLASMNTGPLVRMVVQGDRGAAISSVVVPDEVVTVAVLTDPEPDLPLCRHPVVRPADEALAVTVTALRQEIHLRSQDLGGFTRADRPEPFGWPATEATVPAMRRLLAETHDLHYVALIGENGVEEAESGFHRPTDVPAVIGVEPGDDPVRVRARTYEVFARTVPALMRTLSAITGPVVGATARRLVLDVERGAVYVYPLPDGRSLMAVTLTQDRVSSVEDQVGRFAHEAVRRQSA